MSVETRDGSLLGWISGYRSGNARAGENLARRILEATHQKIRRYGIAQQDAEDLAQACAIEVLRHIEEFDIARGNLDSWVSGFALNSVRMHRRTAFRAPSDLTLDLVPQLKLESAYETTEHESLAEALRSLDLVDRELLHMKFGLEMSSSEIASASYLNPVQARKRISRAVERLRRHPSIQAVLRK